MSDPAAALMIARFPPEIRDAISALLDKKDLGSLTSLSKLYRALFAPILFKKVRVEDSERHVSRLLEALPSGQQDSQVVNVWAHTTHATFTLFPGGRPYSSIGWRKASDRYTPKDEEMPKRIIQCIQLMTSLRVLSIDLQPFSSEQEQTFLQLLKEGPAWDMPHLRMAATSGLARHIIGHCCPETLLSLQISNDDSFRICRQADELCSRLKRLHVSESAVSATAGRPFPDVHDMALRFPSLEWLVIYTKLSENLMLFPTAEDKTGFETKLELFARSLRVFPKLKRFGLLIPSVCCKPRPPRTPGLASQGGQQLLDTPPPYDPATWYFELIGQMSRTLPDVYEICIMGMYPHLYRGTKVGVEMTFRYEDVRYADRFKFPIGLVY